MTSLRVAHSRRASFRPSPIFLGLVALWATGGAMAWLEYGSPIVNALLFVLAGWVVSLSLHEFSHALLAYRAGDRSVAHRGYLTLDPLKYTHPLLSIILPLVFLLLGGIGLPGGAVWIDRHAIRGQLRASLVSLAGPGANVVFLVLLLVPFWLGVDVDAHPTFWASVAFLAFLQLTAVVLNLWPVPGLDGGNALRPWLTGGLAKLFDTVAPFGLLIVFGILFVPELNAAFFDIIDALTEVLGIPSSLVNDGHGLVQFWR